MATKNNKPNKPTKVVKPNRTAQNNRFKKLGEAVNKLRRNR